MTDATYPDSTYPDPTYPDARRPERPEHRPFRVDPCDWAEQAEIRRLLDQGLLRRSPGAVLVAAEAPDTPALRAEALTVALARPGQDRPRGPAANAVIGYLTAAWLHGGGPPPELIDLVIPPGTARPKRGDVHLHEHRVHPRDVSRLSDLTVTTPARTAADLARTLAPPVVGTALDLLADSCGLTVVDVLDQLERMRHARGVVRARELVHGWAAVLASQVRSGGSPRWTERGQGRLADPVIR